MGALCSRGNRGELDHPPLYIDSPTSTMAAGLWDMVRLHAGGMSWNVGLGAAYRSGFPYLGIVASVQNMNDEYFTG